MYFFFLWICAQYTFTIAWLFDIELKSNEYITKQSHIHNFSTNAERIKNEKEKTMV